MLTGALINLCCSMLGNRLSDAVSASNTIMRMSAAACMACTAALRPGGISAITTMPGIFSTALRPR
ncbi:hypothetical protein D3C80_2208930 [compost metagenome]